jgi:hypothetical protein
MVRKLDEVDPRALTRGIAWARIALGAVFTLIPGLALRAWPGRDRASGAGAKMLARSVGVRDLALGLGALLAVQHDAPLRGWVEAGALADAGDAVAVTLAMPKLPRVRSLLVLASAVGAAATGRTIVTRLAEPSP